MPPLRLSDIGIDEELIITCRCRRIVKFAAGSAGGLLGVPPDTGDRRAPGPRQPAPAVATSGDRPDLSL